MSYDPFKPQSAPLGETIGADDRTRKAIDRLEKNGLSNPLRKFFNRIGNSNPLDKSVNAPVTPQTDNLVPDNERSGHQFDYSDSDEE